ncbi:hypothetical protein EZS27_002436 [termite gut metagenome]|uniref:Uncharacterized protein n=1 Tax=termite gut metagenome TaxID=433724 RepID=A0A5J4SY83_9ZZZZ
MSTLKSHILELQRLADELQNIDFDGVPVQADVFSRLSSEILNKSDALFSKKGGTAEEEADLCTVLLTGYNATIYDYGDKECKKQVVLNRAGTVLDVLAASLVKCRLLLSCYREVYEEELLRETREIMDGWKGKELSKEERETVEFYEELKALGEFKAIEEIE